MNHAPHETNAPVPTHYAAPHWPRFYRYHVADRGLRMMKNRYPSGPERTKGSAWIGLAVVVGRYAYCVKWAGARMRWEGDR